MYISKALSWTPSPATTQPGPAPAAQAAGRFLICLPDTLIQECPLPTDWSNAANFSDDPHDPGGATMCGIIQVEYDAYRKSLSEPAQSVRLISQAEGYAIYQANYWQPHCPQLQAGLDLSFFDSAVNMGANRSRSFNSSLASTWTALGVRKPLQPLPELPTWSP